MSDIDRHRRETTYLQHNRSIISIPIRALRYAMLKKEIFKAKKNIEVENDTTQVQKQDKNKQKTNIKNKKQTLHDWHFLINS